MPDTETETSVPVVISEEHLNRVAAKLPEFWTTDPPLWFHHVESTFRTSRVVESRTKYDLVVQKLPQAVMTSVRSLVLGSIGSSSTPYEDLKAKLVASFTLTKWQRATKLIHHPGIGDLRPSNLMDSMLALLPDDDTPSTLFLALFLERLPVEMRDHLVAKEFDSPSDMALHADKLWDARRAQPAVDSAAALASPLAAAALSPPRQDRDRGRDRARSPSRDGRARRSTPGPAAGSSGPCFYHRQFGSAAVNCRPPCSFPGNGPAGGRTRN